MAKKKAQDTRGYSTSSVVKKAAEQEQPEQTKQPEQTPIVETVEMVETEASTLSPQAIIAIIVEPAAVLAELPEERVTLFRADAEHVKEEKKRKETIANTIIPTLTLPERTEQALADLITLDQGKTHKLSFTKDYFLKSEITQETSLVKLNFAYLSLMKMDIHTNDIEAAFTNTCSQTLSCLFDWVIIYKSNLTIKDLCTNSRPATS